MGHAVELSASESDRALLPWGGRPRVRLIEAWTMTRSGPLPQDVVGRVLEDHRRVQRERAELLAALERLAPAWRELRTVLNVLNRVLEP